MSIQELEGAYNQADYALAHNRFTWSENKYTSEQKEYILNDLRKRGYTVEYVPSIDWWKAVKVR